MSHDVVQDYLRHHGYGETLQAFLQSTGMARCSFPKAEYVSVDPWHLTCYENQGGCLPSEIASLVMQLSCKYLPEKTCPHPFAGAKSPEDIVELVGCSFSSALPYLAVLYTWSMLELPAFTDHRSSS